MTKYVDPRTGKLYTFAEAIAPPTKDKDGKPLPPGPAWGYGSPPSVPSENPGEGLIRMLPVFVKDGKPLPPGPENPGKGLIRMLPVLVKDEPPSTPAESEINA